MIKVTIELASAINPGRSKVLGIATISNDGETTKESKGKKGSYSVWLSKWAPKQNQTWKKGKVENFDRVKRGSWDLLYLALKNIVGKRNPDKSSNFIISDGKTVKDLHQTLGLLINEGAGDKNIEIWDADDEGFLPVTVLTYSIGGNDSVKMYTD